MEFSFLSWNVEHFKKGGDRLKRVAEHIGRQKPDVFGLFEVENLEVQKLMEEEFPGYDFGITDGPETQEILVGWRRETFEQSIFTQKREFSVYNPYLRPGALLSLRTGSGACNLLFLHTDSGTDASAFGNRAEMFEKVWKMKVALDKIAGGKGNLIMMGDLNTMGMFFPTPVKKNQKVSAEEEVEALHAFADQAGMKVLTKDYDATWTDGKRRSNLDHMVASQALQFKPMGTGPGAIVFQVQVKGWNKLEGAGQKAFIKEVSDHCSLFARVKM